MLSIIITFFALPIGLWMIIYERKSRKHYQEVFDSYLETIDADSRLDELTKMKLLRAMLEHNYYKVLLVTPDTIAAEKKIFSPGWLLFSLGFVYIGVLIHILYYLFVQKPHHVCFRLKKD